VRALVVEDNPGIRDTVVDLLTRRGHDVAAFGDAETAWETTQHEVYHLAVLDWGLPGMDGIELCRLLRARPGGGAGVILVLTGRADPDDIDDVVAAGADDYLTKPFELDWLDVRLAFAERQEVIFQTDAGGNWTFLNPSSTPPPQTGLRRRPGCSRTRPLAHPALDTAAGAVADFAATKREETGRSVPSDPSLRLT
jgi:DNA-binding response OmpR family regulator